MIRSAGLVRRAEALRNDALASELARMMKCNLAFDIEMLVELNA
jgi:hypothetical protein